MFRNKVRNRIRSSAIVILASLLAFSVVSCNTKKKATDAANAGDAGGEGAQDKEVSDKALTFNPEGSDSDKIGLKTVYFEYDKANITAEAKAQLDKNVAWIKQHSEVNIQVEGHCDDRGSIEYNLSLGERRAQTIKKYLVSLGVETKRVSVISYGKEKLLDPSDTEAAHSKNRRANFLPLPK